MKKLPEKGHCCRGQVVVLTRADTFLETVPLPSPVVARLPEDLAPEVWNFEVEMEALGFRFEPFGEGAVRISAVPETVTDPDTALLAALHALAGARHSGADHYQRAPPPSPQAPDGDSAAPAGLRSASGA